MTDREFLSNLDVVKEVEITVTGRKSGRSISMPVWFVREDKKLYLVPVQGTDSNWYKNALDNPMIQISAKGKGVTVKTNRISAPHKVAEVVERLRSKYGVEEVKKYYSKLDAALEISL